MATAAEPNSLQSKAKVSRKQSSSDDETFTFFWGKKSPFSQWHPAKFTVDGVLYECAEQFMMHQKAGEYLSHCHIY